MTLEPRRAAAALATAAERVARERRDELQQRAGAAGFVHLLDSWRAVPAVPAGGRTSCRATTSTRTSRRRPPPSSTPAQAAATATREWTRPSVGLRRRRPARRRAAGGPGTRGGARRAWPPRPTCSPSATRPAARHGQLAAAVDTTAVAEAAATAHRTGRDDGALRSRPRPVPTPMPPRSQALASTQRDRLAAAEWAVLALPPLDELERALATAQELVAARVAAGEDLSRSRGRPRAGDGVPAVPPRRRSGRRSPSCARFVTVWPRSSHRR